MMNSTKNPRNTKRVVGLGLAALSMSLLGTVSRADNTTAANAEVIYVNSSNTDFVTTNGDSKFYTAQLFANRSYEISFHTIGREWQSGSNTGTVAAASITPFTVATDAALTSTIPVTQDLSTAKEGQMGPTVNYCCFAGNGTIRPTTSGQYFIRLVTTWSSGTIVVSLRETTLFSPWLSKAAGFEGFIELHNNTNAAVNVTLRGHNSTGAIQGAGLSFSIPANATVFKTGAEIGVPVDVAAGVVLTHDSAFGAISGNITTLNGANGLSFDSAFTPRTDSIRVH